MYVMKNSHVGFPGIYLLPQLCESWSQRVAKGNVSGSALAAEGPSFDESTIQWQ